MNIMYPAGVAGVTIAELQPTTRISLRLADPAASGIGLPVQVGSRSVDGTRTALCLAPDEWLVEVPEAGRDGLLAALAGTTVPMSAVEVSDREITWRIEGPALRSKALAFSTWSPPAARATSRGCRSGPAPAPCSTPPRWC